MTDPSFVELLKATQVSQAKEGTNEEKLNKHSPRTIITILLINRIFTPILKFLIFQNNSKS